MKEENRGCSFESGEYIVVFTKSSLVLALISGSVMGMGKGRKVRKCQARKRE